MRNHLYTAIHTGNISYKMLGSKIFQISKKDLAESILLKYSINISNKPSNNHKEKNVNHLSYISQVLRISDYPLFFIVIFNTALTV